MNPAENSFRTAVVGGFNRQDVLNYIESSARESKERVAALQKEAEEAKQAGEAARREADAAKGREDVLKRDLERLQKAEAEKSASLESAQSDLEQVRRELAELREALGALKDKAARWESGAKAYAELKDRTATIELEAHQRARAIESQAEEKAKKVRTAAEQILYKVQAGYGRLRGDVDATITERPSLPESGSGGCAPWSPRCRALRRGPGPRWASAGRSNAGSEWTCRNPSGR